ncbi:hypothetical protein [Brevibacillus laterosporus]|uniref:hypothetical protein n=1 Tax=Brevibacillus laterosporus TaxID=1465 RepID=UPI000839CC96|nr:hypothetical protein [Brevibacillus laterosporus]
MKAKKVGEILLDKFNKVVADSSASFTSPIVRIAQAIPIIEESPMPSYTFTKFGIDPQSSMIPSSLKLSVKMQDEALEKGLLHRINFATVDASTQVMVEHGITYKNVREQMKKAVGREDWELYYHRGISDARLRESLFVDLLSGVAMPPVVEMKTLHALAKRLITKSKMFEKLLEVGGIKIEDEVGVCQFIYRWGFDKFARELCNTQPYYNRRADYCVVKSKDGSASGKVSHSQSGLELSAFTEDSIVSWVLGMLVDDKSTSPEIKTIAKKALTDRLGAGAATVEKAADAIKQAKGQRKGRIGSERKRLNDKVRLYADLVGISYSSAWTDFSKLYESVHRTNLRQAKARHAIAIGVNSVTYPEYLEATKKLSEGIAVAEMLIARYAS